MLKKVGWVFVACLMMVACGTESSGQTIEIIPPAENGVYMMDDGAQLAGGVCEYDYGAFYCEPIPVVDVSAESLTFIIRADQLDTTRIVLNRFEGLPEAESEPEGIRFQLSSLAEGAAIALNTTESQEGVYCVYGSGPQPICFQVGTNATNTIVEEQNGQMIARLAPTSTPVPTNTPIPTNTPFPTETPVPSATPLPTDTPTPAPTNTPTLTPTPTPTATPSPTPTPTLNPAPSIENIGRSQANNPITAYRFGNGERIVVLIGGINSGFAPSGVAVAEEAIAYFDQNLGQIPANVRLYIIPNGNPDSPYAPSETRGRLNASGVDLNRNWGCNWSENATFRRQPINAGIGPFSEPETVVLSEFIVGLEPDAVVFYSAVVENGLASPGWCENRPLSSQLLAEAYANGAGYRADNFEDIAQGVSRLNGDATDWLASQEIAAITVLLPSATAPDWSNNLAGIENVLNAVASGEISP